jgi:hypothetical protein
LIVIIIKAKTLEEGGRVWGFRQRSGSLTHSSSIAPAKAGEGTSPSLILLFDQGQIMGKHLPPYRPIMIGTVPNIEPMVYSFIA